MKSRYLIYQILMVIFFSGCKKSFLDAKPSTDLIQPQTLSDYQRLLENASVITVTAALPQMGSDEYFIKNLADYQAITPATARNSSIWAHDIYEGETNIIDWNKPYETIFYANSVIDGLSKMSIDSADKNHYNNLMGWALFIRGHAMYDLVRTFSLAYDSSTYATDLGIPIKLSPNIDETVGRSSVKQTYEQIYSDLTMAVPLLDKSISPNNRNRPSRPAAYALLARMSLYMRKYEKALEYANSCLGMYNTIVHYKDISITSATPFSYNMPEVLYSTTYVIAYSDLISIGIRQYRIDTTLVSLYGANDLRLSIYFQKNADNYYQIKRGYVGGGNYNFTGLATDEIYLIKAECLARKDSIAAAMNVLNFLLVNRYKPGTFVQITASSRSEAIDKILIERRKELIWRGLRWEDIKRLNKEGANITLRRTIGGVPYSIAPNSLKYAYPIPEDEIFLSGIQQNPR